MTYKRHIKILLGIVLAGSSAVSAHAACGEAGCVAPQGTYISHFSGPGCTGTESYYLPYDGYAYQCRTWDGGGQCGTVQRTVTNRSYFYNGACHDAWPSGNTLGEFVTVYRSTGPDGDLDGLPDPLELSLAQMYFPILNLHCGTYEGLAYGDRRQLYGLSVPGYSDSSNGRLPFVAHSYRPGNGIDCTQPFQCIELRYGIAWNWDLGDDVFGGAHNGDSEVYAVLLARKDTDGSDWGGSLDSALNDPSQWRLIKEFMSVTGRRAAKALLTARTETTAPLPIRECGSRKVSTPCILPRMPATMAALAMRTTAAITAATSLPRSSRRCRTLARRPRR